MPDTLFTDKEYNEKTVAIKEFFERTMTPEKLEIVRRWRDGVRNNLADRKEEQVQADFLNDIFGEVLGYDYHFQAKENWNLLKEEKTLEDASKPDGVLGYFGKNLKDVRAVIELKSLTYEDLDKEKSRIKERYSPVDQAFGYASKMGANCKWVIVSNLNEIRLYRYPERNKYETFFINELLDQGNNQAFKHLPKFVFLLHFGQLFEKNENDQDLGSLASTERIYRGRIDRLVQITNEFYADYQGFRVKMIEDFIQKNPEVPPLDLVSYTQTILDRLVFIEFADALRFTQRNTLYITNQSISQNFSRRKDKFWEGIKDLFESFDLGYYSDIPPFNGELFKPIPQLNQLKIEDSLIKNLVDFLEKYDFKNELKVEILGHIFEQSISDIEEIKKSLANSEKINLRKKDGVFYTPQHITAYMIEQTVGDYLKEKDAEILQELGIDDITDPQTDCKRWQIQNPEISFKQALETHILYWERYRIALEKLKLIDPACGSGAFLTEAFDHLLAEYLKIAKTLHLLGKFQWEEFMPTTVAKKGKKKKEALPMNFEEVQIPKREQALIRKKVVLNNLYGVDLNPESIEITKLSLYLKTADTEEPLADLRNNIKKGNSLISDPKIDAKAFVWEKEFSEVFAAGGFDRVVANPPYVAKTKDSIYKDYDWNTDLYLMFYERSFQKLLKNNGILSFITPRFWLVNRNCADFRKFMLTQIDLYSLTETSPFEDVNTECVIAVLKKQVSRQDKIEVFIEKNKKYFFLNQISKSYALKNTACEILTSLKKEDIILLEKIEKNTVHLSEISESKRGVEIGKADLRKPKGKICLIGQDTHKYQIVFEKTHISTKHKEYKRLESFFNRKNLVYLRRVGKQLTASVSNLAYAFNKNIYGIAIDLDFDKHYILALLNSKLLDYYYKTKFSMKKIDIFPEIQSYLFEALPIKKQADQQIFIDLVSQILSLKSQQKDSSALENQVDNLVYKLYDLTEEEIQFIENQ